MYYEASWGINNAPKSQADDQMNFERAKQILEKRLGKEYTIDIDLINSSIEKLHLSKGSVILDIGTGWGIMRARHPSAEIRLL